MKVIGAGMWRTGTVSLKSALEQLTGEPCHHMTEVINHPETVMAWLHILNGGKPDWPKVLASYGSTLDWPSMAFWRELSEFYPEAFVLLSTRPAEDWWTSVSQTVLATSPTRKNMKSLWDSLVVELFEKKFAGRSPSKLQAIDAYNQHNKTVRAAIPKNRLIEWSLGDGWEPLCETLSLPIPTNDFPHLNTASEYRQKNR